MRWLFPRFPLHRLPIMLLIALMGALIAGLYGAVHDQLSFALSPEYFTKFKFRQFAWADVGWPPRLFASEVGVLACAGVGLASGWLLARAGLAELPPSQRRRATTKSFAVVVVFAAVGGLTGWALGAWAANGDLSGWADWQRTLGLTNLPAFVVVAYLHAGGYLGALVGFILAAVYVRRAMRRFQRSVVRDSVHA
jgi:hypothetical protein